MKASSKSGKKWPNPRWRRAAVFVLCIFRESSGHRKAGDSSSASTCPAICQARMLGGRGRWRLPPYVETADIPMVEELSERFSGGVQTEEAM